MRGVAGVRYGSIATATGVVGTNTTGGGGGGGVVLPNRLKYGAGLHRSGIRLSMVVCSYPTVGLLALLGLREIVPQCLLLSVLNVQCQCVPGSVFCGVRLFHPWHMCYT